MEIGTVISLKDPVKGQFQVTGRYFAHPNGNSYREMLTGAITGPGLPSWASELVADLARQGVIPGVPGGDGVEPPITITMADRVIDLTVGRVSAGEAASRMLTGEPATAVLVAIADVSVRQQAIPGPTASLCDLSVRVTLSSGENYS